MRLDGELTQWSCISNFPPPQPPKFTHKTNKFNYFQGPHTPINQQPPGLQHNATSFFSEWKGWVSKYPQQLNEGRGEALIGKMKDKLEPGTSFLSLV
jgi:hypothetical protein